MKLHHRQKGKDPFYHIWHTHETETELLLFYSEGGNIVFQSQVFPIRQGDCYIIRPGIMHYTLPSQPDQYQRSKLILCETELIALVNLNQHLSRLFANHQPLYSQFSLKQLDEIDRLFSELESPGQFGSGAETARTANILKLFAYFLSGITQQPPLSSTFISQAIQYLNTHMAQPITIADVCREVCISKYHLCRTFKQATGCTIMDYLLKTRLEASKQMLISTNLTISEISIQAGFSSISYFCRVFRNQNQVTPLQFRNQMKKMDKLV